MDNCGTDRKGSYRIGQPIHFVTGEFAGHTIRTELQEVQKANLGRKSVQSRQDLHDFVADMGAVVGQIC
jgi:hypothetical protein